MADKIDMIYTELLEHRRESKEQHKQVMAKVEANAKKIRSLEDSRTRLHGAWAFVCFAAAGVSQFIGKLFE